MVSLSNKMAIPVQRVLASPRVKSECLHNSLTFQQSLSRIGSLSYFVGKTLYLRGVVYYGNHHYTSRIIDIDRNVWFNDGMTTGRSSQSQGSAMKVKSKYFNKYN